MNVMPRVPTVPPATRAEPLPSAPRRTSSNTNASFEDTLARNRRADSPRNSTPVDEPSAPKEVTPETGRNEEIERQEPEPSEPAATDGAAESSAEVAPPSEDNPRQLIEDVAADPEAVASEIEIVLSAELVVSETVSTGATIDAVTSTVAPQAPANPSLASTSTGAAATLVVSAAGKTSPSPTPPAFTPISAAVDAPDGPAPSVTGDAAGTPVPSAAVVPMESTTAPSDSTHKPGVPSADPVSLKATASSNAVGGEQPTAPAPPLPATPAAVGKEAFAAQFAQTPTGDDPGLRDDANLGRVVRGLGSAINQRGGSVTIRLTPPELGAVRIDMTVRDGVVNARFTAATESVRHLLTDQMSHLRGALDRQGLVVERIEVQSVAQQSSAGGFDRQMDDAGRDGRSAGEYTPQGRRDGRGDGQRDGRGNDSFEQAMIAVPR